MTTTVARASFDFSGTTTVITGGASGIGLSCAEAIARAGGGVIISSSRNPAKTDAALQRLRALAPGVPMSAHPCEVGDEASVAGFFGAIAAGGARVDHLIHSAGVSPNTDFLAQTQAEWDQVHNINATGSFLVTKHAAGLMRHNEPVEGWRGRIVLITSTNGINSNDPVSAHYDSSKAGNNMLVRNAAEALAPLGIVVNGLAPGWINTALNATLPPEVRARESAKIWMQRWAEPGEVATAALHVLTLPYYMAQVLLVDGGYR
jgi:NAD(P)-dependent dehydrogenase (short-subunit alcohol dehydrogenase family)